MNFSLTEKEAVERLESQFAAAQQMLNNKDQLDSFLQLLDRKLKVMPIDPEKIASVPTMVSFLQKYIEKGYTGVNISTVVSVLAALIYLASPLDGIPDTLDEIGYIDDIAVIDVCWKSVGAEVEAYLK